MADRRVADRRRSAAGDEDAAALRSPQLEELDSSTVLPLRTLAAIVSLPCELMPPPPALHPFGADAIARLRLTTVLFSVRFLQLRIPAPLASLAIGPPA